MKKIIFTVTTDLSYDQRMQRICQTLADNGYAVEIIGRKKKDSISLKKLQYIQTRMKCLFNKGKLFYIEYNLRLLIALLFKRADIVCSIDLDTIIPGYIVAKVKRIPLVYDAHEYFTEMIEVVERPKVQKMWLHIESYIVPRLTYAYTVSEGLRRIFSEKYKVPFSLIRNISSLETFKSFPPTEKYIIYAGVVNAGRGLEQLIEVMPFVPLKLYICGNGDLFEMLQARTVSLNLTDKVIFKGYVPPQELKIYIRNAYLGYLMLENKGLSYYYSLANKFFDYIHAGIPQITIDFPEYKILNDQYHVADLIPLEKEKILHAIRHLIANESYYQQLSSNAIQAREKLNWQMEAKVLLEFYNKI